MNQIFIYAILGKALFLYNSNNLVLKRGQKATICCKSFLICLLQLPVKKCKIPSESTEESEDYSIYARTIPDDSTSWPQPAMAPRVGSAAVAETRKTSWIHERIKVLHRRFRAWRGPGRAWSGATARRAVIWAQTEMAPQRQL